MPANSRGGYSPKNQTPVWLDLSIFYSVCCSSLTASLRFTILSLLGTAIPQQKCRVFIFLSEHYKLPFLGNNCEYWILMHNFIIDNRFTPAEMIRLAMRTFQMLLTTVIMYLMVESEPLPKCFPHEYLPCLSINRKTNKFRYWELWVQVRWRFYSGRSPQFDSFTSWNFLVLPGVFPPTDFLTEIGEFKSK